MGGYKYQGTGTTMTEQQVQEHLAQVRARIASTPRSGARDGAATSALATSSQARDAALKPPRIVPGEVVQAPPVIRDLRPPPALKGAVKVNGFPARSVYPFREIAEDGGVWKIDPAAFTWRGKPVKDISVRAAAWQWASRNGWTAKAVLDGGMVYVQFTRAGK